MRLHLLPDQQERCVPDVAVPRLGLVRFIDHLQHLVQEQGQEVRLKDNSLPSLHPSNPSFKQDELN